ncbi:hypothetical protein GA0111570_102264 [Raineyella antarctica]|uniref:Uncharacterized protein n=1 Tax=Raineyella antarctica TaxID=1577474 RepID=A0A1G6GET0_9ACTN|nr:hypothetical protein [Raineyella antarctica]SDB80474.1 hypothetical protein GA0111570_102264 [Raineyella antarctica]
MTTSEHHVDTNPVRPSSAEGDPDEELDDLTVDVDPHASPDPHAFRPSQAEGEPDED